MELVHPWLLYVSLGMLGLAIVLVVFFRFLRRNRNIASKTPIVNSDRLTELPAYRRRVQWYQLILGTAALGLLSFGTIVSLLAARPVETTLISPEKYNRDIVLCLDISGSMQSYDVEIIKTFETLVSEFKGERVSLVLWNSSPVQLFPLTDDYSYIAEQLESVRSGMESFWSSDDSYSNFYWIGTDVGEGSSLIGDGYASCLLKFDRMETKRSRSLILATDNFVAGDPIIEFTEANELAKKLKVKVYGINPISWDDFPEVIEMKQGVLDTGGQFYQVDNPKIVRDIVRRISLEQASAYKAPAQWVFHDEPQYWLLFAVLLFVAYLAVVWRLKI